EAEYEQFFGKALRGIGGFLKKNSGLLKNIAKVAAPIVGTAIGGPFGGMLAKGAVGLLGGGGLEMELEGEFEYELEGELEMELEAELEHEHETLPSQHEMEAEYMASIAARAQTEHEAETMIGSAVGKMLSSDEWADLKDIHASLVRAASALAHLLYQVPD